VTAPGDLGWMRRAVVLARGNLGRTWPNPVVGCVLVLDGVVAAEACTAAGGRPHAEEQALAGPLARGADAYLTLEPCARRSNGSPSCSERLIASGVRRVVIACDNPDPLSSGQGPDRLVRAGVAVVTGVLAAEAGELYRGFRHRLRTGLPLLETAGTGEGFDAAFEPWLEESLAEALRRYAEAGYTRLWTPAGSELSEAAAAQGLLGLARGSLT